MSTHKQIDTVCIVITVLTLLLTLLFMNGASLGITAYASEEDSALFTQNDLDAAWDVSGATKITLSDDGSTVSGNGAYVYENEIHILYAGKYIVSGTLSNGKLWIEADGDDKIWLMLSGASIHCDDDAAIRIEQAEKVFLTLKDGTQNTLSSGAAYSADAVSDGVDGVVYSRDDLTVNGSGSLSVTSEYRHGIVCNDDLVIAGGTLEVSAVQDGIHANDSVRIKDASLTVTAGDDGITASNDEETAFVYIDSGTVQIPSCYEGIEAVQITVAGGKIDISPTDDGLNANSYGGSAAINITGGELSIINETGRDADGLDSNKDIFISGGYLFISVSDTGGSCAIDYGSEYGGVCEISGGVVLACGSAGMAEGFDASSTQGFVMYATSASAGTTVAVTSAGGEELFSKSVPCSFSSVLVSAPELTLGDTCILSIGGVETELTIDNSSNGFGGFGGIGGGRIPGGKGFGGRGNRGAFGELPDAAEGTTEPAELTPTGFTSLSAASTSPEVPSEPSGASAAQDGGSQPDGMPELPDDTNAAGTPPDFPQNGMNGDGTSPDFPQDGMNGDGASPDFPQDSINGDGTFPDFPQDGMNGDGTFPNFPQDGMNSDGASPDFPQNDINGDGTSPDFPQDGRNGNTALPDETQENATGGRGMLGQKEFGNLSDRESAADNTAAPLSSESILLLCVSAAVLLIGCLIAFRFKHWG